MRRSCSSTRTTSPRPASIRSMTCCSACPAPAAASTASSTTRGNLGNPPDGGGVGAGSAEIDLRYLSSRRVLVLVDGIRYVNGASASRRSGLDRPQLDPRQHDRADRSAAGRRFGDLRLGRDRRRGQHHHQEAARRASMPSPSSAAMSEGDGFTQNYQLSWGNGGDGPLQVVVGGNFVKQKRGQRRRPRDFAHSRHPIRQLRWMAAARASASIGRFASSALLALRRTIRSPATTTFRRPDSAT